MQSVEDDFALLEHSLQHKLGIEYTTPFMFIIPGLPFTFVRDFLSVSLEVKTICTPSGLHALLIFSLMPLMYGRNTLGRPLRHPSHLFLRFFTIACFGYPFAMRAFWTCILSSAKADPHWLCDGGSLQRQTSPLDGAVSCSGGSGLCGWVSCMACLLLSFFT